jgi:hypothetical protein
LKSARLTRASTLIEQAFGTELEFSALQLQMLHAQAERWSGSRAGAGR